MAAGTDSIQDNNKPSMKYILDKQTEKILRILLENPKVPYTKSSLAEVSDVSRDAIYNRWDQFKEHNIIEEAPTGGKQDYYRLNTDSETVDLLGRLIYLDQEKS